MTFTLTDLAHLRWSLPGLLLALCTGSAAVLYGKDSVDMARSRQQDAQHRLTEARGRLAAANEDHATLQSYAPEYIALLDHNVIGDAPNPEWIATMERIRKQERMPGFRYAIAPQQPYTPVLPLDAGNFNLAMSGMSMQLDLLHEEQLLNLLDALHTNIKGRFILERCTLERNDALQKLKAECAGSWLTLNKSKAQ